MTPDLPLFTRLPHGRLPDPLPRAGWPSVPATPDPIISGHATDVGQTDNVHAIKPEVVRSLLSPWVKQRHEVARFGIDGANVTPLPAIAHRVGQRQVVECRLPSVLLGNDMIHLRRGGCEILGEQTVFTAVTRLLNHLRPQLRREPSGHESRF
jgi:hypothetical protein